jgi:hypothetical protein
MEVFISYETTTGLSYASNLKKALERVGVTAFVANEDIKKGTSDKTSIDAAISDCRYFVVVMTMVSLWSEEVSREIELANKLGKEIIPCKPITVTRIFTKNLPFVSDLQQIDFESKEHLADQVVTEIINRDQQKVSVITGYEEASKTELANIQAAVVAMMIDNNLTSLPHPVIVATNDMSAFPDANSTCAVDKLQDPQGNAYVRGKDKDGYLLFQHDIIGDASQIKLVNYVATRYAIGTYTVDSQGTVYQTTTGYE